MMFLWLWLTLVSWTAEMHRTTLCMAVCLPWCGARSCRIAPRPVRTARGWWPPPSDREGMALGAVGARAIGPVATLVAGDQAMGLEAAGVRVVGIPVVGAVAGGPVVR